MYGIFGPRFEKGRDVERIDTGERGVCDGDPWGDYIGVKWKDGSTSWTRLSILRLLDLTLT